MKNYLLFVLVIGPLITFAQLTPKSVNTGKGVIGFYEFKPAGYNPDSTYLYPLIIFMHGIGERGNGKSELRMALNSSFGKLLVKGASMKFTVNGRQHAFLVLIPQMSKDYENWQNFYVDDMIEYARKNLKIDTNKIFLTGWSLGGGGAWKYATASVDNAKIVAGIIPVSPAPDYTDLCNLTRGKVAVWAHHARDDASVPLHYTEDAVTGINACSPDIPALITYYPSGGHPYVADWAYDTLNRIEYPNVYQWMIGTSRANTLATNQAPICKAGNDTAVILPSTQTTLNGSDSFDPNDVIVQYKWQLIAGPASPAIKILKSDFPSTDVSGLEPGNYTFRLTVRDEFGASSSDEVNLRVKLPAAGVNVPPLVDAGADVTVREGNYHLKGNARDFDGKINSFQWRQVSGPVSISLCGNANTADLWGMTQQGTYGIELAAYDNNKPCGVGKDTVLITRKNIIPVYFNYWSKDDPIIKDPAATRYTALAVFALFLLLPGLIFNSFTTKKFEPHNFDNV